MFNSFNMPYGQAQYVARVLNNRATARWRKPALEELKARLLERKADVYSWPQDAETSAVEMKLFKSATKELEIIIEDLFHKSPGDVDIPSRSSWGNLVAIKINARTFKKVCEQLGI